ncbi:unnamed protein product [Calypogeia fissa]
MYSAAAIQAICEQETLSGKGYYGNWYPGFWRKREKWKMGTRVRLRSQLIKRVELNSRCVAAAGRNGDTLLLREKKKVQVRSRFATTITPSIDEAAAKSGSRKVTETEANEVCPVPWTDTESLLDQLPLKVRAGLVLENLGTLYDGPNEDKYWSRDHRCGLRHPYPVGYTATKTYKGVQFKQTIESGPDGPIFVVGVVDKAPHSADSPTKAWALALESCNLNSATRVHGRKHFGFDCPIVLGCLSQLSKEHIVRKGLVKDRKSNLEIEKPRTSVKDDSVEKLHLHGNEGNEGDDHKPSKISEVMTRSNGGESWSSSEQSESFERSIRLRSVRVEDTLHQRVQVLSCQDTTHPVTRGILAQALSSRSNEGSSVNGTVSNDEFSSSGLRTSKPNPLFQNGTVLKPGVSTLDTSLDSILRRMDEVAGIDEQEPIKNSTWKREDSENIVNGRTGEQDIFKQNSSIGKFFTSPIHRSKILLAETTPQDTRRTAQARSLANLLEEWNKGGRPQSLLNGKPQVAGDHSSQLLRRPTRLERTGEEKDDSGSDTTVQTTLLDSKDADMDRKVEDWRSGKQGRLLVLKEIQQLVVDGLTDQALQILRNLYSKGVHLDDAVYSAFFTFTFDDWQKQAVRHAQEKSVLVSAPGGAGKFVVAARCLYQAFVQGERCLVVAPSEALAKYHWRELQLSFGTKHVAYVASKEEDRRTDFAITVITLEALIKELREGSSRAGSSVGNSFCEGLSVAVMDRFHTFGGAQYGSLWEEAVMLLDHKVKLVALSGPTKSSNDILTWMSRVHRPCELVVCESEPVQKQYYYCNASGLHPLGSNDEKVLSPKSQDSSILEGDAVTNFQEHIRVLLKSIQSEAFLPVAVGFSSIEDCISAISVAKEVITDGHISAEEVALIEERVQHFFRGDRRIEPFVNKDDIECLSRGFCMYHDGQSPLWTEFLQGLFRASLVKIVFGTTTMLSSMRASFKTVALCSITVKAESGRSLMSSGDIAQLCGTAGRRGRDSCGNVVFVGENHTLPTEAALMNAGSTSITHSHFQPSYGLLLNLLSKHTLPEVRQIVERSYGEYLNQRRSEEELKKLEVQISDAKARKADLESQLFQKLQKLNTTKLQDATTFTHVDIRVTRSDHGSNDILRGVLCAVLPGPSKLLYMILCADNIFRLLPAGAFNHVYTDEKPLDVVCKSSTGHTLRAPPLPSKARWKPSPGDYLAYTSEGTAESARVVEALIDYGVKARKTEDEPRCREEIRSCNELLSALYQQREVFSSRPTITWTKSEKLIETLVKADAVELASKDTEVATIKPLGVLISKLHHVENELWFTTALSSSIVKPLTAPELAAICSAFLFTSGETDSESSGNELGSVNKASIAQDAPKRLRVALEKLEHLRKKVEHLQGSDCPPIRLDGSAVAAVHSLCRESVGQDSVDDVNSSRYQMVSLVQKIIKLLHAIDDAWGRSLHVLPALEGTSGLHNLARRASHLLEKALGSGR